MNLRINDVVFVISASGPYSSRDIRSLYPSITDNHLRYLEKWGLIGGAVPRRERVYSFTDLLTVKRVAAELEAAHRFAWCCARWPPSVRDSWR